MVDSTLIYEMKTEINPESSPEPETKPRRGRPKKVKTPEEIEQDRIKYNEYSNNYQKQRIKNDPAFAEKYRAQLNVRCKRYAEKNKEILKQKRDETVRKSKLYDELIRNSSV